MKQLVRRQKRYLSPPYQQEKYKKNQPIRLVDLQRTMRNNLYQIPRIARIAITNIYIYKYFRVSNRKHTTSVWRYWFLLFYLLNSVGHIKVRIMLGASVLRIRSQYSNSKNEDFGSVFVRIFGYGVRRVHPWSISPIAIS